LEQFSLSKLNLYIRRVIAVNFEDPIWIDCELLSVKEKSGHIYLDLIEKDEQDQIIAQSSAVIWKTQSAALQKKCSYDLYQILSAGNKVLIAVTVDYNARYGLKLIVQDLDSSFTLGKLIQSKLKVIERLKSEQLWQKNKECNLPCAIKKIAIIGSSSSAGFRDFINQLEENHYAYTFKLKIYEATMQGNNTSEQIGKAFELIKSEVSFKPDMVVIIRGGGSKHDLLDFDEYAISKAISECPYPVFTGIGHFIDESLADLSAYTSLKTPTAVAEEILHINHQFESELVIIFQEICSYANSRKNNYKIELKSIESIINNTIHRLLFEKQKNVIELKHQLYRLLSQIVNKNLLQLESVKASLDQNDPDKILSKGYSLVYKNGQVVKDIEIIELEDLIETKIMNGKFKSIITEKWLQKS